MTKEQVHGMTHVYHYNLLIHLKNNRETYNQFSYSVIHYLDL